MKMLQLKKMDIMKGKIIINDNMKNSINIINREKTYNEVEEQKKR